LSKNGGKLIENGRNLIITARKLIENGGKLIKMAENLIENGKKMIKNDAKIDKSNGF
jgi:hypothetical protein